MPFPYATHYRLIVNDSTGNKVDQWYTAEEAGCASGTGICSVTPSIVLALGNGNWKIQTRNSYGDGPWSSALNFNIVANAPKVDFNGDGKTDILWRNKIERRRFGLVYERSALISWGLDLPRCAPGLGDCRNG